MPWPSSRQHPCGLRPEPAAGFPWGKPRGLLCAAFDNFCWGNTDRPETLGSLVLAAEACRDMSLAYNMAFISGKDSLKNEYHSGEHHLVIPPTLLISAMGRVPYVRRCVSMDLKASGNFL